MSVRGSRAYISRSALEARQTHHSASADDTEGNNTCMPGELGQKLSSQVTGSWARRALIVVHHPSQTFNLQEASSPPPPPPVRRRLI